MHEPRRPPHLVLGEERERGMKIEIGPQLALPVDAITQTFGILAVRGAGKSNLAAVMAEGMFKAGLPFVVIDPVSSWWGLRSGGDGKSAGLPIPIFGGSHGDVPLESGAGALVADMVIADRLSCVVDVSAFSEGDKTKFLIAFAERLYQRNSEPLHLFLEEADDYCPQKPFREQAHLLRAWENIVRRGRARGLGITMVTQRSAALNKSVLTQIETLFVLRTTSPQDRKAIAAWVQYQGQGAELLESLQSLESGEAWVWSPSWLKTFERIKVRRRWTFDSGATPKNMKASRTPATLADVDLEAVKVRMSEVIERQKAEDPRELRRTIAELRVELKKKDVVLAKVDASTKRIEAGLERAAPSPELKAAVRQQAALIANLRKVVDAAMKFIVKVSAARFDVKGVGKDEIEKAVRAAVDRASGLVEAHVAARAREIEALQFQATRINEQLAAALKDEDIHISVDVAKSEPYTLSASKPRPAPLVGSGPGGGNIGNTGARRMLIALAQHPEGCTYKKLALLSGISQSGGTWRTYMGQLRSAGFVSSGQPARITDAGLAELGAYDPLPSGPELIEYWRNRLGNTGKRRIFDAVVAAYPRALSYDEVSAATAVAREGGTWRTYVGELRSLELIVGRGDLRASEELFV